MAVIRRVVLPILGAVAAAAAVAACAYAVVATLPQPTRSDRIGVDVLRFLQTHRGHASRMVVDGTAVAARCRHLAGGRSLVSFDDGRLLVLRGARITGWSGRGGRSLASASPGSALRRAAEADLAGSYKLYATELTGQLERGQRITGHAVLHAGRPAYEIDLAATAPRVVLVVDRDTLRPLAARFESPQVTGTATLSQPRLPGEAGTC